MWLKLLYLLWFARHFERFKLQEGKKNENLFWRNEFSVVNFVTEQNEN